MEQGQGETRGHENVAVAVWTVPSVAVASAMMVAFPVPYAVAIPPGAPGFTAPLSLLTVKMLGSEESHVTVLVRSLTYGAVEKVPMARKFPVPCKLATEMLLGITVSEIRGSGSGVDVVVMTAGVVSGTTVLSGFV
jgi:hypothetical protein